MTPADRNLALELTVACKERDANADRIAQLEAERAHIITQTKEACEQMLEWRDAAAQYKAERDAALKRAEEARKTTDRFAQDNGGPAHPCTYRMEDHVNPDGQRVVAVESFEGLTVLDYFAAQVLPWCLAEFGGNAEDQRQYAEAAYQIADAMLAERRRRTEPKP